MSFWDDHCPNLFEYEDDEAFAWGGQQPRGKRKSTAPRCRLCGRICSWGQRQGRWVLMENLQPHRCQTADTDFEEE